MHPCMVHWAAIDRSLLAVLKPLVLATATVMYKVVQRQSTFVGGLEAILHLNGHGIQNRLDECFEVVTQTVDYANTDGTFEGVTATDAMHALISDFQTRTEAFEVAKDNSARFCLQLEMALKCFPTAIDGETASVFNDPRRDLRKADVSSSTEEVIDIILTTIHTVGATELTGTIIAAVPRRRRHKTILPVIETAASTIYVGGKGGSGGTGKGKGKGNGDHRPLCLHGANCKNFGTLTGCSSLHTDKDRAEMQHKLGDKFVNRDTRMRVFAAMQAENQPTAVQPPVSPTTQQSAQQGPRDGDDIAVTSMLQLAAHARHAKAMQATIKAAPILPSAQQPPVPQPEPTAAAAKLTEAATYLAMIKKVQDHEYNGSGSQQHSGAAMSAPRDFAVSSLPIMQEASRPRLPRPISKVISRSDEARPGRATGPGESASQVGHSHSGWQLCWKKVRDMPEDTGCQWHEQTWPFLT